MSILEPRRAGGLHAKGNNITSPRVRAAAMRAIDEEVARALVHATRIQGVGFATEVTLLRLEMLSRFEAAMAAADPIQAQRYNALVEDFLLVARTELRQMASGI